MNHNWSATPSGRNFKYNFFQNFESPRRVMLQAARQNSIQTWIEAKVDFWESFGAFKDFYFHITLPNMHISTNAHSCEKMHFCQKHCSYFRRVQYISLWLLGLFFLFYSYSYVQTKPLKIHFMKHRVNFLSSSKSP